MNLKTLKDIPEKKNECVQLIEKSFNYSNQFSFEEDFPLLFTDQNQQNCYLLVENDKVIATLFCLPRFLVHDDLKIPVLFIGGISVSEEHQGDGLFRSLLETVLTLNSDVAFYFLWSDLSNLYQKFSFYEFGLIKETTSTKNKGEFNYSPNFNKSFSDNYNLLSNQFFIPERTQDHWDILFQNKSIQKVTNTRNEFFCIGKGMDLHNICHERLPLTAQSPVGYTQWDFENFEIKDQENEFLRYMGFLRLGNIEIISMIINQTSKGRLKIVEKTNNQLVVEFDSETYELSEKDFIQGIWGPGHITEWVGLVPQVLIFGFDSI